MSFFGIRTEGEPIRGDRRVQRFIEIQRENQIKSAKVQREVTKLIEKTKQTPLRFGCFKLKRLQFELAAGHLFSTKVQWAEMGP